MSWNLTLSAYKAGALASRLAPGPVRDLAVDVLARLARRVSPQRRRIVERNLRRVVGSHLTGSALDRMVHASFAYYGRYWSESFRLPTMDRAELDVRHTYEGYEHIQAARAAGYGPLMVIPHMGPREMPAVWLTQSAGIGVTAVVEAIKPPELFEWFVNYREALGIHVVPLGPGATGEITAAIRRLDVICLLADRDIARTGTEVVFFGERTTLPSGPALLALRTGAPLIPCAAFFKGTGCHTVVLPPLPVERQGRLRDDVARVTQSVAHALEQLIARAPEQWHLMEPNWPSDRPGEV